MSVNAFNGTVDTMLNENNEDDLSRRKLRTDLAEAVAARESAETEAGTVGHG